HIPAGGGVCDQQPYRAVELASYGGYEHGCGRSNERQCAVLDLWHGFGWGVVLVLSHDGNVVADDGHAGGQVPDFSAHFIERGQVQLVLHGVVDNGCDRGNQGEDPRNRGGSDQHDQVDPSGHRRKFHGRVVLGASLGRAPVGPPQRDGNNQQGQGTDERVDRVMEEGGRGDGIQQGNQQQTDPG